jgi:hypothetical protein
LGGALILTLISGNNTCDWIKFGLIFDSGDLLGYSVTLQESIIAKFYKHTQTFFCEDKPNFLHFKPKCPENFSTVKIRNLTNSKRVSKSSLSLT